VARDHAEHAAVALSGARKSRCEELSEKLANAICHADRLDFIVVGNEGASAAGKLS